MVNDRHRRAPSRAIKWSTQSTSSKFPQISFILIQFAFQGTARQMVNELRPIWWEATLSVSFVTKWQTWGNHHHLLPYYGGFGGWGWVFPKIKKISKFQNNSKNMKLFQQNKKFSNKIRNFVQKIHNFSANSISFWKFCLFFLIWNVIEFFWHWISDSFFCFWF